MSGARAAELALVGVAAVWGLTFVMVQDAIALLPPLAFLAYRFLPAAALVALVFHARLAALGADGWRAATTMGAFLTVGYVFQTVGLADTTVSNAGFITGLYVVLTPVFGAVLLGERIPAPAWAAAAVSALGLFLLSGAGSDLRSGDLLMLGCAVAFAGHILVTARAVRSHDAGALLAVQLLVTGVVCVVVAAALGDLEIPRGATVWSALLVTSLVASALGLFIQTAAQRRTSPARTALILASEPAFAGLFGYWLAGERLPPVAWLGAGMIMTAIVGVELVSWRRRADLPY